MGMIWQNMGQVHSIPIQQGQGSYDIGMGLIHIIPTPDTIRNLWNCAKYVAIPYIIVIKTIVVIKTE